MENVTINTEFIKLDSLLKYVGLVGSGADAKMLIYDGMVKVNGEVEIRRGRKIRKNDIVTVDGNTYNVI